MPLRAQSGVLTVVSGKVEIGSQQGGFWRLPPRGNTCRQGQAGGRKERVKPGKTAGESWAQEERQGGTEALWMYKRKSRVRQMRARTVGELGTMAGRLGEKRKGKETHQRKFWNIGQRNQKGVVWVFLQGLEAWDFLHLANHFQKSK